MYNNLLNNEVVVLISARTENVWEYTGVLCEEDTNSIKLKDVEINLALLSAQQNMFGNNLSSYKSNIEELILNKNYIIACYKK